ncbi:hypothetical protein [Candidatus Mycolicibacterium alkanivorans]|uniref:Alanine and proline rich membrane protein n=1 Tax=Candidatus Mycolicibacterium alkanivorans TaxID=2954114 RepID=A0ABS9Z1T8_9MYCO|nr:hypothetical protein [Candidatus Mycolicibacterium alkanivorans]MCI4677014.1 hypothetical protein [Candidatus Mycolicibacterium alkanivorans]
MFPEAVPVSRNVSGWVAAAALLLALAATGLAVWALVKPPSEAAEMVVQQPGDPKTRVCDAFDTVASAVKLQTHADAGRDQAAVQAVAANARLALLGGGMYLQGRLSPDTPPELADPVRLFAKNLQEIGINALAGAPNSDPVQAGRLRDGEDLSAKIVGLCQ